MFITLFTKARHLSLFSARSIQCTPSHDFFKIRFNIILPCTPRSVKRSLPSGFPTKTLYAPLLAYATCSTHLILLDMITRKIFCELYKSWSSSLRNFLHSNRYGLEVRIAARATKFSLF